jgi:hypothetical protein
MTPNELADLRRAKKLLGQSGLSARLTRLMSIPIEKTLALMPASLSRLVGRGTRLVITQALSAATATLRSKRTGSPARGLHTLLVTLSGAGAGLLGLPALAVELPLATAIMLRSIAAIARSEGQDLADPRVRLECVQVFALGGAVANPRTPETGYFAVRAALARSVAEAAQHLAQKGLGAQSTPALIRFITQVAARFGVVVSDKLVAQAVPLAGAVGGGLVNWLFIRQFQRTARGHFTVRRLEQRYGEEEVRRQYDRI